MRFPLLLSSAVGALVLSQIVLACVGEDPGAGGSSSSGEGQPDTGPGGPTDGASSSDVGSSDGSPSDGGADADAARCNPEAAFGAPVPVTELNTGGVEDSVYLTADELTAYFIRDNSLYVATRNAMEGPFDANTVSLVAKANQDGTMHHVAITHDGQVLYTVSSIESGPKVFFSTAGIAGAGFSVPQKVSGSSGPDFFASYPYLNTQKSIVYYNFPTIADGGGAPHDAIHTASILAPGAWGAGSLVSELFSSKGDRSPVLSADQKTLYFASKRDGEENIYVSKRASTAAQWGTPVVISPLVTPAQDAPSWISDDGCRLYLISWSSGNSDIYVAHRGL